MSEVQTKNRVTMDQVDAILSECVFEANQPDGRTSTFVHVYTKDGYLVGQGHSACVDPANYNAERGLEAAQGKAYGDAVNELFKLEGYALRKDILAGRYVLTEDERKLPAFLQRLIIEGNELAARLANLQKYLNSGGHKTLDEAQQALLHAQVSAQESLLEILRNRLKLLQGA